MKQKVKVKNDIDIVTWGASLQGIFPAILLQAQTSTSRAPLL